MHGLVMGGQKELSVLDWDTQDLDSDDSVLWQDSFQYRLCSCHIMLR